MELNSTDQFTDHQIKKIMNSYKRKRERESKNYHEKLKCDQEWCKENKQRALDHYYKNIDKNKEKYQKDKDFVNSRSMYSYYKRINKIDTFIEEPKIEENNIILSFD